MKNSDYWKKRFEQLETAANNKGLVTTADLEIQYMKAQRQIEGQINSWYQRFATNNQVTMAEARKMLNAKELAELKWDVKEYIKYGHENELNQIWMKQLENASAKFHISRLEALKLQTQQTIEVLYGNQTDAIDALVRNTYTDGYYHTIYEIQKGFNIGWDIASVDKNKLEKLISRPWAADGKNFSERIWSSKTSLINEIQAQLTQTCILGKVPDDAIKNIAKKMNVSKNQSGRLVMTESAYFSSACQKDAFTDLDVEKYEIVATLDSLTSTICQDLDGHVFDMKDYEPGVTAPPFHVWCRTTTVPWFEDDFYGGERAARGEDGKTYYVPDNMKYKDWFDKTVKDNPGYMLKIRKEKNILPDKKQFEKYKAIFGDEIAINVDKFQDLKYNNIDEWNKIKSKKQDKINSLDFSDMQGLVGKLSNYEIRHWYNKHDLEITNLIDKTKPLKEQAIQANELRNRFKQQARELMANQKERENLERTRPILPFEYYVKKYSKVRTDGTVPTTDEVYKEIIKASTRTNKHINKIVGLDGD